MASSNCGFVYCGYTPSSGGYYMFFMLEVILNFLNWIFNNSSFTIKTNLFVKHLHTAGLWSSLTAHQQFWQQCTYKWGLEEFGVFVYFSTCPEVWIVIKPTSLLFVSAVFLKCYFSKIGNFKSIICSSPSCGFNPLRPSFIFETEIKIF